MRFYKELVGIFTVILLTTSLTLISGCSHLSETLGLSDPSNPNYDDPIARQAMMLRTEGTGYVEKIEDDRQNRQQEDIQYALESGDITLGMDMQQVITAWGRPRDVETAGESGYGNQKWLYHDGASTRWKISDTRVVYFEQGHVVGWETLH